MNTKTKVVGKEIVHRTGIDFQKYQNPELFENLRQICRTIINPVSMIPIIFNALVVVFFAVNVLILWSWYKWKIDFLEVVFLFVIGNISVPLMGIPLALMNGLKKMHEDIVKALNFALDLTLKAYRESDELSDKKSPSFSEVFSGVIYVTIIPSLEQLAAGKLKCVVAFVMWLVEIALVQFAVAVSKLTDHSHTGPNVPKTSKAPQTIAATAAQNHPVETAEQIRGNIDPILYQNVIPGVFAPIKRFFSIVAACTGALLTISVMLFA